MAKKNRRRNRKHVRVPGKGVHGLIPRTLFGVLMTLTVCALSYLYLCGRCDALGKRIYQLEKQRDELRREIVNEEFKWSNLTAPENMQKLLQKHNLTMVWPSEESVVRVRRNPLPQQFARETSLGTIVHD